MGKLRAQYGFTLVELMTVLLVAAILLAVAVPAYRTFVLNSQLTNAVGDISAMIGRARSEAISRYRPVTICGSSAPDACDTAATDLSGGWLMFVDDGAGSGGIAGDQDLNGTEEIIQVGGAVPESSSLALTGFGSVRAVTFDRSGLLGAGGALVYCDERGEEFRRAINVSMSGQVRVATDTTGFTCP